MHNSARLDYYLSDARDFPETHKVNQRFLICTSPRCGSTLFGQMLYDTGKMGDPLEYLNPAYLAAYFRRFGGSQDTVCNIISKLEKIRTSPNGNFGIQLHFSHFIKIFNDPSSTAAIEFMNGFDRVLFIRRRDRIRQAISLYRARATGLWSSLEGRFRQSADNDPIKTWMSVPFDPERVTDALHGVVAQDQSWLKLLERFQIEHLTIHYEDLVSEWAPQCARALSFLNENFTHSDIPQPNLEKQSSKKDGIYEDFINYLGLNL